MRVTRLLINGFRGWDCLDLRPNGHVLLAGVPRAGRSDVIAALGRVLDPDAVRSPALSDLHQCAARPSVEPLEVAHAGGDALDSAGFVSGGAARSAVAEVEVTLSDFDPHVQQLFDGCLEPLDPSGQASEDVQADHELPLCARMTYRLAYDYEADILDAMVYFPARSNPAIGQYAKVPAAMRRALPVVPLSVGRPLQLRAGGNLRRFVDARDPIAAMAAFEALREAVSVGPPAHARTEPHKRPTNISPQPP